jgi:hypothetical protein
VKGYPEPYSGTRKPKSVAKSRQKIKLNYHYENKRTGVGFIGIAGNE